MELPMEGVFSSMPSMVVGNLDGLGTSKPKQAGDVWRRLQKQARQSTQKEQLFFTFQRVEIPAIRVVLTRGIAGIGKTFSVYKFIHDVAEGRANSHIDIMIPFSFRELNTVKKKRFSLLELIHEFHPTLRWVTEDELLRKGVNAMIIFDGLDQSTIPLYFDDHDYVNDVTVTASVSTLVTNLITANLFPQAQLWITTRPAAAVQIPREFVDRVTEVRGFVGPQKEEYFMKRFNDKELAQRFIAHMHTSKRLSAMCHVPLFCSIVALIAENDDTGALPDTMCDVLFHFLMIQDKRKKDKHALEMKLRELMESETETEMSQELLDTEARLIRQERMQETDTGLVGVSTESGAYWHSVLPKIHARGTKNT